MYLILPKLKFLIFNWNHFRSLRSLVYGDIDSKVQVFLARKARCGSSTPHPPNLMIICFAIKKKKNSAESLGLIKA